MKKQTEKVICEAGIGDNLWLLQTLDPAKSYDFEIIGSEVDRAHQLFELVPALNNSIKYLQSKSRHRVSRPINLHLETGNRLETYNGLCNWELPIETAHYKKEATKVLKSVLTAKGNKKRGSLYFGLYGSAMKNVRRQNRAWDKAKWQQFISFLREEYKNVQIVGFGAEYDDVLDGLDLDAYVKDEPLGTAIEAIKMMDAFVGFQSGIPIFANYYNVPTIMFFFERLRMMHNSFNKPGVLWKGCTFPRVQEITQWMQKTGFPFDNTGTSGA